MQFLTSFPHKYFSKYTAIDSDESGIVLRKRGQKSERIYWKNILSPPVIEQGWLCQYFHFTFGHKKLRLPIARVPDLESINTQFQRYWVKSHEQALCQRIEKLEQLLRARYLSAGLYNMLQEAIKPYVTSWLSWQVRIELTEQLSNALTSLRELSTWQQSDLIEFREAYIGYKLSEHERFFDSVESSPLTAAQRRACVIQDNRQLLLAGAGTGKTSVMVAKAQYLLYTRQAYAKQILMLAYGNEAAREMADRAQHYPTFPACMTFHKLGMLIIETVEGSKPKLSTLCTCDEAKKAFIFETLLLLSQEEQYRLSLTTYAKSLGLSYWESDTAGYLASREGRRLIQDISSVLTHLKNARAMGEVSKLETKYSDALSCIQPILAEYSLYLRNDGAIDFEDIIIKSTDYVVSKQFISPWTHLLVDEFQDISPIRAKLLYALLEQSNRHCLFSVGDDWQSIYRFSGADVTLTTDFTKFFGAGTVTQLDQTFRYHQALLDVSSTFICANPTQIMKRIRAYDSSDRAPLVFIEQETEADSLTMALQQLNHADSGFKDVLLLARYHRQLPDKSTLLDFEQHYRNLDIKAMTFHAAKGKEADYAVLMGLEAGKQGFPAEAESHNEFLEALLPVRESFPFAEERRLFYVALTRAKQQVYLIKPRSNPCPFLLELDS